MTGGAFIQRSPVIFEKNVDSTSINLVITLGGDGTILHASSLFREGPVPPVLSFSLGTLGFLLPFHIESYQKAIAHAFSGHATVLPRMRLACRLLDANGDHRSGSASGFQLMNEVTLHRGRSPHLAMIDAYIDGQHLTESLSDGLIISTPTGSTAYSLSSGGPIVHPSMKALLLTPICPRSLSFRPLLLPGTCRVELRISRKSRAPVEVSMDGQDVRLLHPDQSVVVEASPYPIPCINRPPETRRSTTPEETVVTKAPTQESDGWVRDINRLLHFNTSFKSSALVHTPHEKE
ncbi:NADH kinase pos5 [Tulasnella sp. 332]|nr:NADH kinase pos5 [Tulasnella sp. 332]